MRTWENKILNAFTEAELNALGAEGWELVAVFDRRAYLKREVIAAYDAARSMAPAPVYISERDLNNLREFVPLSTDDGAADPGDG